MRHLIRTIYLFYAIFIEQTIDSIYFQYVNRLIGHVKEHGEMQPKSNSWFIIITLTLNGMQDRTICAYVAFLRWMIAATTHSSTQFAETSRTIHCECLFYI